MATTRKAHARKAMHDAKVAMYLDQLIDGTVSATEMTTDALIEQRVVDAKREAVKRYRTDYPEMTQ